MLEEEEEKKKKKKNFSSWSLSRIMTNGRDVSSQALFTLSGRVWRAGVFVSH
jgi:hypothetical protein